MNKSYISVWNDASGTWVAAPETARARSGKGASSSTVSSGNDVAARPPSPLKAAFMPIAMAIGAAMLPGTAAAQATTGNGGLELCPAGVGGVGSSWGPLSSAIGIMDCNVPGQSGRGMSFSLNNAAADNGAWGFADDAITARVTGYDSGLLELKGTAGISMLNTVDMNGNKISSLASGSVSSGSADAVNGAQLYQHTRYFKANSPSSDPSTDALAKGVGSVASGPSAMATGGNSSAYGANSAALASSTVALGAGSVAARADSVSIGYTSADGKSQYTRQITNVTAGAAGTDAVNVEQLNAAIASVSGGNSGGTTENAVTYDSSTSALITLKGTKGTRITNLVAGDISSSWSTDAVNGSQLYQTNQNVANVADNLAHVSGNLANVTNVVNNIVNNGIGGNPLVVAYDSADRDSVTLGGVGNAKAVRLTNVAAGDISSASSTDAVNGGQLYETNQNLHDLANNVGQITTNIYNRGVKYFHANSSAADSSAVGTDSVAIGGLSIARANNSVALGANSLADRANTVSVGAAASERQIANVAAGTQNTDAVNVAQLNTAIANASISSGSPDAVVYDSSAHDMLTLGGALASAPVGLTNVAAGKVVSGSTDAVNGGQLYSTANSVAAALGAGASVNQDGTVAAPGYVISGMTYDNVGDAFRALNSAAGDLVGAAKYVKVISTANAAMASGGESVAIGGGAMSTGNRALAIGAGASAAFDNSTAIGVNAVTDAINTVSVGSRGGEMRITHVANGIKATDAATVAQLDALQSQLLEGTQPGIGVRSMLLAATEPVTSYIAVSPNVTGGAKTSASPDLNAMAIGPVAAATGVDALSVGAGSAAGSVASTAVGSRAGALSVNSTAIGAGATVGALSDNSVSIGYNTRASALNSMALGGRASATSTGSVAIGYAAFINQSATNGMALGLNASVSAVNGVAIGYNSVADRANAVSVGSAGKQNQITYVAAGTSNTDAVNVKQLSGVISVIGGGAAVNPDGTIKSPSFTIGGQTYTDVGSAIAAAEAGGSANAVQYDTTSHTKVTLGGTGSSASPVTLSNVANGVANNDAVNVSQLQAMGATIGTSGVVTNSFVAYDDTTLGAITLKGAGGTTITNVKGGALTAASLDAVNGSQLYQTNANVANVAGTVANVTNTVNNIVVNGGGIKYFHVNSTLADSSATGANAVAIGGAASASAANSVALGSNSVANRANAVSVGAAGSERQLINVANGTNGTDAVNLSQLQAMGANVNSSGAVTNSFVAYDDTTLGSITLKGTGGTTITNVKAGAFTAASHDAVNGSQLYNTANSIATAMGGGAAVQPNGTLSAPSYVITGSTYNDVGSALGAVDGQLNLINTNFSTNLKYVKVVSTAGTAQASGLESIAIGGNAMASGDRALAIGAGASAGFRNSTAIGVNASADADNTVSVGSRGAEMRITHVANGIDVTDAATVAQLNALQSQLLRGTQQNSGVKSMLLAATPVTSYIDVSPNVTPGSRTSASTDLNAMAIGPVASATGYGALTIGAGSVAGSDRSTTVGSYATVGSINSTAVGAGARVAALSDNSVSIGYNSRASGLNTIAVGTTASASSDGSIALGYGTFIDQPGKNGLALGINALVSAANGVAIGYNSVADRANAVSVGSSKQQTQIINVAAGTQNTDAVNLAQMTAAINAVANGGALNAVIYDSPSHVSVTLGSAGTPVKISNVADGVANNDAVNVEQLKAMGATIGTSGAVTNAFVAYDDTTKGKVTFGGGAAAPVVLTNVAAGQITSSSKDAINGTQLYNTASSAAAALGGGSTVGSDGKVSKPTYTLNGATYTDVGAALVAAAASGGGDSSDAVKYDTTSHNLVTLGKAGTPVKLSNVADGVTNNDAVNVGQLKAMGATISTSGTVMNAFVAYDDTAKGKVTFGGFGATTPVILTNVGAGQISLSSKDAVNGSQLYNTASTTAAALGGGSAVGADGKVSKPSYTLGGSTFNDVGAALAAVDAKATSGSVNGVVYDTSKHDKLTLGGAAGAQTPVTLANVAAATSGDEAVNLKQLTDAGLKVDTVGKVTNSFVAYDDTLKGAVTFNAGGKPTQLKNVATGTDSTDAVNFDQMKTYVAKNAGSGGTPNGVAYDDASKSKVTLGGTGSKSPVTLTNVAAGSSATDAVNYSQFTSLQSQVNNLSNGGGAGNTTYVNINTPASGGTAAVASGSDSIAIGNGAAATGASSIAVGRNTVTAGDSSVAMGAGASAPNTNAVALGASSTTDRDNSVSVGSAGAERQITNVAAGMQSTDAVNMGQLNNAMGSMNNSIHNVDRNAAKGIASASALNIVTPYLPGRTTLNAGIANYRGYQAVGLGVSRWNEKGTINYNLGVSTSGGNSTIVRAGIGIVLGN